MAERRFCDRTATACQPAAHVNKPVIDHTAGDDLLGAFIEVSDVNALHQQLQTAGARIWQAPRDEPWAMCNLIVSDLDDNLICFASNLAGASEQL
jgi:hypothetical protein